MKALSTDHMISYGWLLLRVGALMFLSCTDIHLPPVPEIVVKAKITGIQPEYAKAGDLLAIYGEHFNSVYYKNTIWVGNTRIEPSSGNETFLRCRLPYALESGTIYVNTIEDSVAGPELTVFRACDSQVCLSWYSGPTIFDFQTWVIDCAERIRKWEATVSGDTVALTLLYCYGDDSTKRRTIRFRHLGNNILPEYIDGEWWERPFPGTWSDSLRGYIAIENWSIPGTISGRVSTYINQIGWDWEDFNFYYESN